MATKLQNLRLIQTKQFLREEECFMESNLKKVRTLRIAQLNKAMFDTKPSSWHITHEAHHISTLGCYVCSLCSHHYLCLFVATYMAWISLNYSFLTFQSGPHSTASCQSVLVTCPPLWVSLRPGPLSLSRHWPLLSSLYSLSRTDCSADCSAGLAWLSLASHDPVRTRWALSTHSPLPPSS